MAEIGNSGNEEQRSQETEGIWDAQRFIIAVGNLIANPTDSESNGFGESDQLDHLEKSFDTWKVHKVIEVLGGSIDGLFSYPRSISKLFNGAQPIDSWLKIDANNQRTDLSIVIALQGPYASLLQILTVSALKAKTSMPNVEGKLYKVDGEDDISLLITTPSKLVPIDRRQKRAEVFTGLFYKLAKTSRAKAA